MMKRYGGGGHKKAGGARVHSEDVDRICQEIIEALH
jgi:nanoRNase/pAp phosphatase (c-di-AMP/oligoRNAs hydrolase)